MLTLDDIKKKHAQPSPKKSIYILLIALFLSLLTCPLLGREINLRQHWDEKIALENPHKGWYHHYPDNHINKYIISRDEDLTEFPGMDHLYIRMAWAYLEPQEGQFNWDIIDQMIEKWVGHGLGIAFRISCKETSTKPIMQQFATPKWVMEAGAQGGFYRSGKTVGPEGPWEPVFDDPIFLAKLENFLKAFGQRYDGKPWLRYIDIGSIGDWGEGHTHSGSRRLYNYAQRKVHVDLYLKYFTYSQLCITDDFVYNIADKQERLKMHQYVLDQGITYRDDSPLVNYYVGAFPETYTIRSPEYFAAMYKHRPIVFELEHYSSVKRNGNWTRKPDSLMAKHAPGKTGPDFFRGALELLHATYIGYHGYAHEWLAENPDLTVELLNRCGYWYFPHTVNLPNTVKPGEDAIVTVTWENRGVAPAYHPYDLVLRLHGPETMTVNLPSGNKKWLPSQGKKLYRESYKLALPDGLTPGEYSLSLKLFAPQCHRTVFLALDSTLKDEENFYKIGTVKVAK